MKPLFVLIGSFLITLLIIRLYSGQFDFRLAGRVAMAIMLVFTAIGHFVFSKGMTAMVPEFVPLREHMVLLTGLMEILFAIGLLIPAYSQYVGWALIIFFLLVLPSNIKAAVDNLNYQTGAYDGPGLSYLWFRIPLQALFIAWVYLSAIRK